MDKVKRDIIAFWLTHGFLRRIAKRYPEYFTNWMRDLTDNKNSLRVMNLRYIDNLKFEAVAYEMNIDVRNVFLYHKQVIDLIISGV